MAFSRRGFLQGIGAVACTAVIKRPEIIPSPPEDVLEGEIIDDTEVGFPITHPTRLEVFLKSRGIKPAHLARESGYSRQHLLRIRLGRMEPTRRCIVSIVIALRRMTGERVRAADVFDLGERS